MYQLETLIEMINNKYSEEIDKSLSDEILMETYQNQPSTLRKIDRLKSILEKNKVKNKYIKRILNDYSQDIIAPGTKGSVRGLEFNNIVKTVLLKINLPKNLILRFEEKCCSFLTDEIPDWYIEDKINNKVLIGMNQIDLWTGGAQANRGSKYILQQNNLKNKKILCVICSKPNITRNNKCFNLFNTGFENKTLCYVPELEEIIYDYFK